LLEVALMNFVLGPLPDGVPEHVLALVHQQTALESEIRNRANGLLLSEDQQHLDEIRTQILAGIERLLTPHQFEEFIARQAALRLFDADLEDLRLTPAELREIAMLHVSVFGPFAEELPDEKQQVFQEQLKSYLGDQRF